MGVRDDVGTVSGSNGNWVHRVAGVLVIVFAGVLTQGCSSKRMIRRGESFEINRKAALETTQLTTRVSSVRVKGDSLIARARSGEPIRIPLADVRVVTVRDRGRGATLGTLIGIASGALLGYAAGEDNSSDALGSREEGAGVVGMFGAGIGYFVGMIVGANKDYVFEGGAAREAAAMSVEERFAYSLDRQMRAINRIARGNAFAGDLK